MDISAGIPSGNSAIDTFDYCFIKQGDTPLPNVSPYDFVLSIKNNCLTVSSLGNRYEECDRQSR